MDVFADTQAHIYSLKKFSEVQGDRNPKYIFN